MKNIVSIHPTVSIIMPAYNAGEFIAEAIESVCKQTYPNWELIIVNDGSTDNTAEVVSTFHDSRIRLITIDNLGINSAVRNMGLRASKGNYISFLDADDLYEPDAIEQLWGFLKANPSAIAVYGFETFIDVHSVPVQFPWYKISFMDEQGQFQLNAAYCHTWPNILDRLCYHQLQSLMIPRTTLEAVGLFDENLFVHSDTHFYVRLFQKDFNGVHFIEKPVFKHRIFDSSISNDGKRVIKTLDYIPYATKTFYQLLVEELGLEYTRSYLAGKFYSRYLAIRMDKRDFKSVRHIMEHAFNNSDLEKGALLKICAIQLMRAYLPSWILDFLRNHVRSFVKMLTMEKKASQRPHPASTASAG